MSSKTRRLHHQRRVPGLRYCTPERRRRVDYADSPSFPFPYYDMDGKRIDLMTWARQLEDLDRRQLGYDTVGSTHISTVWFGIPLGGSMFWDDLPPLIFETMTFSDKEEWDKRCWRYATIRDALAGHASVVKVLKELSRSEQQDEAAAQASPDEGHEAEPTEHACDAP